MTGNATDTTQGPFEGSRCMASPGGRPWASATIRRVNEDGTFKIEFDSKEMNLMPYWHGVTAAEVSFDDPHQWKSVFARISGDEGSLTQDDFVSAMAALGAQAKPKKIRNVWTEICQTLFNLPPKQAKIHILDEASAYRLFLHLGFAAKQCAKDLQPDHSEPFSTLYWNQTRMGGREPSEVSRRVTLEDALVTLGLEAVNADYSAAAVLRDVEQKHAVRLPKTLKVLLQCEGVARAVKSCHPNAPSLIDAWGIRRGMRRRGLNGDCELTIMVPHQGDHEWVAAFDDDEDDARVYVRWTTGNTEMHVLTAPSVGMFFWDLAQTGLAWYQDSPFKEKVPVRRSDIGLILDR